MRPAHQRVTWLDLRPAVPILGDSEHGFVARCTRDGGDDERDDHRRLPAWRRLPADVAAAAVGEPDPAAERGRRTARALSGRDICDDDHSERGTWRRWLRQGDPGYAATAVLLGESALALARDRDQLSDRRGVLTPASAMGDVLLKRLAAIGVTVHTAHLG